MNQYLVFSLYALFFGVTFQRLFIQGNTNLTLRGRRVQFILLIAYGYLLIYLADRALG
jgi:putative copper export protein